MNAEELKEKIEASKKEKDYSYALSLYQRAEKESMLLNRKEKQKRN